MEIVGVPLQTDVILPPVSGIRADCTDLAIGTQVFSAGQSMPAHYHRTYREVVVVMEGQIVLEIDGAALTLSAGDKCVIEIGSIHSVRNMTESAATLTYLKVPFDPDDTIPVES